MERFRKYNKVRAYGHKDCHLQLVSRDYIIIEEKLNGSNASIIRVGDKLYAFSRRDELSENYTLNGFYHYVQSLDVNLFPEGIRFYGEWLVPQKIKTDYGVYSNKFYLFDVFISNGEDPKSHKCDGDYLKREQVKEWAEKLGFPLVPVFYEGEYISDEHLKSFVGKSMFGASPEGEGIIIKCHEFRSNRDGRQKWAKMVTDRHAENGASKIKTRKIDKPKSKEYLFIDDVLTDARILKQIQILSEDGIWDDGWTIQNMGEIIKITSKPVIMDILEEEMKDGYDIHLVKKNFNVVFPRKLRDMFGRNVL